MTEKEKMLAGELYCSADPQLVKERVRAHILTQEFNKIPEEQAQKRMEILRELFGKIGDNCYVEPVFRCDYGYNITAGDNLYLNFDCILLDIAPITIGDNCFIGPRVCVFTVNHPLDVKRRNQLLEYGKPVSIQDHVWIGGSSVINPGVTIGEGAVVASGSVVTKDVEPYTLVGGNPARLIRRLSRE